VTDAIVGAPTNKLAAPGLSDANVRYALWLLLGIYTLNFVDRQIVAVLGEDLKRDLNLDDTQFGLLGGLAFAVFYTVLGIPIARFAERGNRVSIISAALAIWSGFTALCGTATSFMQILLFRFGVGVGEAGCTPPAHSLISDYVKPEKRASALALYSMGVPIGTFVGFALGAVIAANYGWRAAFMLVGVPGVALAIIAFFTLKEPRKLGLAAPPANKASFAEALRELSRRGDRPDVVVLNPPRRGVAPEVRQAVAELAPKRIVYVSCEPDTLARDLDHLARRGYATDTLVPFDMIPLSREVESVVVLAPRAPTPLPVLARTRELALVAFGPRELDVVARAREAAGFEGVVLARWGHDAGVIALARDEDAARTWAPSIASAEVTWHALVRGVVRAKGSVSRAVDGVEARTRYKRVAVIGGHSLLEVRSEPAHDAVIAHHLDGLGHPVLGAPDGHVPSNRHFAERYALDRPFLAVARITITTPEGARWEIEVPRSGDLATVLARLETGTTDAD